MQKQSMKWWGRISIMVLTFFVVAVSGYVSQNRTQAFDQESYAVSEFYDGPLGSKIIDILCAKTGTVTVCEALTEDGHVYQFDLSNGSVTGGTSLKPKKVYKQDGTALSDVEKIFNTAATNGYGYAHFAQTKDGKLYAWGVSDYLGIGSGSAAYPQEVKFDDLQQGNIAVKKIVGRNGGNLGFIITEDGNLYATGNLQFINSNLTGPSHQYVHVKEYFDTTDGTMKALPKIIDGTTLYHGANNYASLSVIDEDGYVYISDAYRNYNSYGEYGAYNTSRINNLSPLLDKSGNRIGNIKEIIDTSGLGTAFFRDNDNELYAYYKVNDGTVGGFERLDKIQDGTGFFIFENIYEDLKNMRQNGSVFCTTTYVYTGFDNKMYKIDKMNQWNHSAKFYGWSEFINVDLPSTGSKEQLEAVSFHIGDIPSEYENVKKVFGYSYYRTTSQSPLDVEPIEYIILTNEGGVFRYVQGDSGWASGNNKIGQISFGDLTIKAKKKIDQTTYNNKEKYNNDIIIEVQKTEEEENDIKYSYQDLITNENSTLNTYSTPIELQATEDRIYREYKFYIEGKENETQCTYIVDLFKKVPELNDVEEGGIYPQGKTIELGFNGFGENTNTATLQKDSGEAQLYTGGAIDELGNYTLVVTDQYGNTNTYHFMITDKPVAEELVFTPSVTPFVYDIVQTKPDGVLGNFSLRYAEGEEQADIDTITIDSGDSFEKFEIVGNQLKVKATGTQLDAGTYTLQVSGTDTNGMPFSGTVTIVVEKAEQDAYQITNGDMTFELDKVVPITTTGKKGDGAETFDIIEGKDTIASMNGTTNYQMKSVGSFKLQATIEETQNYEGVTVEKVINLTEIPEQPNPDDFYITSADTIMYGDNNNIYIPTVSDTSQGTITWSVTTGTDVGQLDVDEVNILKVGQFTIQATRSMSGYKDLVVSKEVTVTPRITTVTPNQITKLEGQTWASVTQNGVTFTPPLVSGDEASIGEATLGYASGYDDNTGQGTYPEGIEIKNQFDNENYVFTYEKGVLEVIGEDLEDGNVDPGEDGQKNPYYSVSGTKGKNGWYLSDITITSKKKDGYDTLSNDKSQFSESIIWTQNGEHDVNLYFKHNTTGAITNPLIYHAKIDKDLPTIQIQYAPRQRNFLESIVNFLSFDHYFSEAQSATFIMSDATSGVNTAHYSITEVDDDGTPIGSPVTGSGNSYALDENKNYKIEVYAEDVAGNVSTTITEMVSIDATAANVIVKGSVDGQDHPTATWTYKPVTLTPEMEDGMDAETWEYSIDGGTRQTLTGTSLVRDNNLVREETIVFYGTKPNGSTGSGSYIVKIDPIKPVVELSAENEDGTIQDGETSHDSVTLTFRNTAGNVSGTTYQCSTNGTSYSDCTSPITVSGNGSYHYYVKAVSGAGMESDVEEITFTIEKLVYEKVNVNVVELESPSIAYVSGTWANKDVQFTLNGGIVGGSNIAYEYTKTAGSTLSGSETWNAVTGNSLTVSQETSGEYYWFRVKDNSELAYVSDATHVKIDKTNPDVPTLTMETINDGAFAKLVNFLSFGQWMKESIEVSVSGNDDRSGVSHFVISETIKGSTTTKQLEVGEVLLYNTDIQVDIQAKTVDNAGNESGLSDKVTVKIDRQAPTISGVQDQEEYKHYYLPRYVGVEDLGSGIEEAYIESNGDRSPVVEGEPTAIKEAGVYHVYAIDVAGNIHELTFEIVDLPIISDFKGWDEEKEIIDQVQREFEEQYDHLDNIEKQEYDQWLKDAMEEWLKKRNDQLEDDSAGSKVEIVDKDKMDPRVTLHTDPISEDEIPYIPKEPISIYDAYLLKTTDQGSVEIDPAGNIKVYLPYSEIEEPIVYEINDSDQVRAITVKKENGYVSFETNKLYRYAISNEKQPDNVDPSKKHPCAYDAKINIDTNSDGKADLNIDLDGDETADINIDVDGDDRPDINIDTNLDGKADYNIDSDGDCKEDLNVGPRPEPWNPDNCNDQYCTDDTLKPEVDIDTNGDGKPDINIDIDGDGDADLNLDLDGDKKPEIDIDTDLDGKPDYNVDSDGDGNPDVNVDYDCDGDADLNLDVDGDNRPDINIDTDGDGKADYNIDSNDDGKPDINIGPVDWKVDTCTTNACGKKYCTSSYFKPYLNIDTDQDGRPDINLDLDGDNIADINIDIDGDWIPDIDIDSDGDGVADINVDSDGDGRPEENLVIMTQWKPDTNVDGTIAYDTMSGLVPDSAITEDNWVPSKEAGNFGLHDENNTGGAITGDKNNLVLSWLLFILSGSMSIILYYKKKRRQA